MGNIAENQQSIIVSTFRSSQVIQKLGKSLSGKGFKTILFIKFKIIQNISKQYLNDLYIPDKNLYISEINKQFEDTFRFI
jgi:hypothetical protein